ncbi:MAG: hypothetical protein HY314_08350 [Acidobacteria bacterium]|nr:hypothetical protein [Acidobacteriota bacterium]
MKTKYVSMNRFHFVSLVWLLGLSLMLGVSAPAFAQSGAPNLLQFHGRLIDPMTSQPITTPTQIRVQIIQGGTAEENPTTGRVVFSEQADVTPDDNGAFDYLIGSHAPGVGTGRVRLDAEDFNTTQPVFVEIALVQPNGSAQVVLPRQRLGSVPYALQAADAAVDERLVNVEGDTMTGPLQIQASLQVGSGGPSLGVGDAFVAGTLQVGAASVQINGAGIRFPDGTIQSTAGIAPTQVVKSLNGLVGNLMLAGGANITITPAGNTLTIAAPNALTSVAHNTTLTGNGTVGTPLGVAVPLSLSGSAISGESIFTATNNSGGGDAVAGLSSGVGVRGESSSSGVGTGGVVGSGGNFGVLGITDSDNGRGVVAEATGSGVGVSARSFSGRILEALSGNGFDVEFRVENNGNVFADGAFNPGGADFAEVMEVGDTTQTYEAGDVLVIDPNRNRCVAKATEAYSTLVARIYSTKPGVLSREEDPEGDLKSNQIPMAVVGIVPTKVSAENGQIRRGDLLVTSSRPGYAMKGTDRSQMLGAIVGKALEPLPSGAGMIKVLVTLQ